MIDIKYGSTDPRATRLSNFTQRTFIFEDVACASIEGILQALKEPNEAEQVRICASFGKAAKQSGDERSDWKKSQMLWWKGRRYCRNGRAYQQLITHIYDVAYAQDPSFKEDLLATGMEDICHSIGNPDQRDTVLTEVELLYQLNRLRIRAIAHST